MTPYRSSFAPKIVGVALPKIPLDLVSGTIVGTSLPADDVTSKRKAVEVEEVMRNEVG